MDSDRKIHLRSARMAFLVHPQQQLRPALSISRFFYRCLIDTTISIAIDGSKQIPT